MRTAVVFLLGCAFAAIALTVAIWAEDERDYREAHP